MFDDKDSTNVVAMVDNLSSKDSKVKEDHRVALKKLG